MINVYFRWKSVFRLRSVAIDGRIVRKLLNYLVGTQSAAESSTNSQDVIRIGQAICPKLSRINASHDEYEFSECRRSDRCKRARRLGDVPVDCDVDGVDVDITLDVKLVNCAIWSISSLLIFAYFEFNFR